MIKIKDEQRTRFIKVMLTEDEYKYIQRFSHLEFQNKSEFIRTSIEQRIDRIKDLTFPHAEDRIKDGRILKEFREESKEALSSHKDKNLLQKADEQDLNKHREILEERRKKLEIELEDIKTALKKI